MAITGYLKTNKPIENAMKEIKDWLCRLGISGLNLDTRYDAKTNIALLRFTYKGQNYEFISKNQSNCRLNMWAIARVMEGKVRAHIMKIEEFNKSMKAYIQIGASEEAQARGENINYQDESSKGEEKELCLSLGITHLASNEELEKHYKKLAKSWHPDMAGSEEAKVTFENKFAEINETWNKIKKIRGI